jgi:acetate kinase
LRVLTVNAGSSSLKLRLLGGDDDLLGESELPAPQGELSHEAVVDALARMPDAHAVGHRIVHGGERFREPVRVDEQVERALRELTELAPLHQPTSLAALDAVSSALPDSPAVACFDTAFHSTLPREASTYAIPASWRERFGLRRYGFHGLSHAYATRRADELLGEAPKRLVICHLGAGASLAAIADGRSVDTTMGFTPLEGLVMATRSGSVDPGMLLWLLEREAINEREMVEALERDSGLIGLAGTPDMASVLERAAAGDGHAALARDIYVHRLRAGIAAMAASLGGLDALVFTGGVGENAAEVRALALRDLGFLSAEVDGPSNDQARPDARISPADSRVVVLVIHSREDLEIARQVREVLGAETARS